MGIQHFRIREIDSIVFEALRDGTKRVETRAASPKYSHVKTGDTAVFDCEQRSLTKRVVAVTRFADVGMLLEKYSVKDIAPWCDTREELEETYARFPDYPRLIAQFGIVALELE